MAPKPKRRHPRRRENLKSYKEILICGERSQKTQRSSNPQQKQISAEKSLT
jgi:hypothetical protein